MVALALVCSVCVEIPYLLLIQFFIIDRLLSGAHYAVISEISVGSGAVFQSDYLHAGLHLSSFIEGEALGINSKYLDSGLSGKRLSIAEIEAEGFVLCADTFCALDIIPAGSALSVCLVILVAVDGAFLWSESGIRAAGSIFLLGKLKPAGLHLSVYKGVVTAIDLFVNLIFDHAAVAVKEVPESSLVRIIAVLLQTYPAALSHAVAFCTQIIGVAVDLLFSGQHVAVGVKIVPVSFDLGPLGFYRASVTAEVVP